MKLRFEKLCPDAVTAFNQLLRVFEQAFEMRDFAPPPEAHLQRVLHRPDFLVFVAWEGAHLVGGLTAYILHPYYSEKPLVYLYDLAVLETHQRRGIGHELVKTVNRFCAEAGCEAVFVQADRADAHALEFYRSTHPTAEEDVVHFSYTL